MGRRSKLPPTIPEGFTLHDGNGRPEVGEGRVIILTAMGSRIRTDTDDLSRYAEDPWIWRFEHPRGAEILAYRMEGEDPEEL